MVFNVHQLDQLDYDDAEPLLDDYINDALQAFVKSKTGKAHIKQYPEGGFWIGTFIEMAFLYSEYTLPKMTKGAVQEVMEYILPRKLTLVDPSATDTAIAELVAFWTFLDEAYGFRSAKAIVKYLQSIADKFPQWMFDPNRGGFAKQFLLQGNEAGFDMSTQAGVEAFQQEYNRSLPGAAVPPESPPTIAMTTPPPDMVKAFELLGLELPNVGEALNPSELFGQFFDALENLDPDQAEALMAIIEEFETQAPSMVTTIGPSSPNTDLRSGILKMNVGAVDPLTEAAATLLREQTITEVTPGTILQDFQATLDFVAEETITLSGKLKHFSAKLLEKLNQRLSHPIQVDLKRPVQKSYGNIHGLYLLLRATQLVKVVTKGKQNQMVINAEVYDSWQRLNATEKYFSLLEAWLIRSHPEMLGEERSGPLMTGDRCLQSWSRFTQKKSLSFSTYDKQDEFFYYLPGIHNVALMEMFGLLKLTSAKPDSGKGWRVKKLEPLPFGKALMALLQDAYVEVDFQWPGVADPNLPLGDLQPFIQPYFPEWRQSLPVSTVTHRGDRHIFKVSLGKIWRRIAIAGDATLAELSHLILDSVDFDHDHLDKYTLRSPTGRLIEIVHPWYFEGPVFDDIELATNAVKIGSLPLNEGDTFEYLFDFGDCWEFQIQLEAIEAIAESESPQGFAKVKGKTKRKANARKASGEIIEVHGEAPQQYPDY